MGNLIFLFGLLSCVVSRGEWRGLPLPPNGKVEKVPEEYGHGIHQFVVELKVKKLKSFDSVFEFYENNLGEEWTLCPSVSNKWEEWDNEKGLWRQGIWANQKADSFFWVSSYKNFEPIRKNDEYPPEFTLGLIQDSKVWTFLYWSHCNPRDSSLVNPFYLENLWGYCYLDNEGIEFSAQGWIAGTPEVRGKMLADLICRGDLLGLNEEQVLKLLGEPDETNEYFFIYRINKPDNFGIKKKWRPPPPPPSKGGKVECPEGWYELSFNFHDGKSSKYGIMPISVLPYCRIIGP